MEGQADGTIRRRRVRWVAIALSALLVAMASVVAGISWQAAGDLIHPARQVPALTPLDAGLAYERVTFATEDGIDLVGWWIPSPEDAGVIVFLHGYGDSRNQSLQYARFLHHAGFDIFAFDFRAHGESGGVFTTAGLAEAKDVAAAVVFAASRPDANASRIILFGLSMGGAAALHAAASGILVHAVIVDSTFASLDNIVRNSLGEFTPLPGWPFGPLTVRFASWRAGIDVSANAPAEAARGLAMPVLIIQGDADPVVRPSADGQRLSEAVGNEAEYWLVPGGGHVGNHVAAPIEYRHRVLAFLSTSLDGPDPG